MSMRSFSLFEEPDVVTALRQQNYHTACIGGVGFFNKQTNLSRVFPGLFDESHWRPDMGVTHPASTENQFRLASSILERLDKDRKIFLFINISALHQPNYFYLENKKKPDSIESHAAALRYVDDQLPILTEALKRRTNPTFFVVCSDHGTAYGEDGFHGHRLNHTVVGTVPYADGFL